MALLDEGELADIVRDTVAAVLAQQEAAESRRRSAGWGPRLREALRDFKGWFSAVTVTGPEGGHEHAWRDRTTTDGAYSEQLCVALGCPTPRRYIAKSEWAPGRPEPPPEKWAYVRGIGR